MKIIEAARAMVERKDLISNVVEGRTSNEYYFLFNGKHKWSILKSSSGGYALFYYATSTSLEDLASFEEHDWDDFRGMRRFSSNEVGGGANQIFKELYDVLEGHGLGLDDALDDIIGTAPEIPF